MVRIIDANLDISVLRDHLTRSSVSLGKYLPKHMYLIWMSASHLTIAVLPIKQLCNSDSIFTWDMTVLYLFSVYNKKKYEAIKFQFFRSYCDIAGLSDVTDECDAGYYCTAGSKSQQGVDSGNYLYSRLGIL